MASTLVLLLIDLALAIFRMYGNVIVGALRHDAE
jgi:hypothetical protein